MCPEIFERAAGDDAKGFGTELSVPASKHGGMASDAERRSSDLRRPDVSDVDQSAARYLYVVAKLSGRGEDRVSTGELRRYLNVAPASATGMITKLDDRGFVDHEKYRGVTLTEAGEALTEQLAWRVCVVSTFFDSELGATLDERTAFEIAYVLPETALYSLRGLINTACLGLCPEADRDASECVA